MATILRSANRGTLLCAAAALLLVVASGGRLMQAQTTTQTFPCPTGFTEEVMPPVLLTSLQFVENPVIPRNPTTGAMLLRPDLAEYIANLPAAIRLGKALFWEMQAGSDNKTACATCHHHAGEDGRLRNQLNPGKNGAWDNTGMGPNADLTPGVFPFTVIDPASDADGDGHADLVSDTDDVVGSQGVRKMTYGGLSKAGAEITTLVADPVFTKDGKSVRQVTGRNTPNTYNAVFNHRNFFDGRAQTEFNGVNPFGRRDPSAKVWYVSTSGPLQTSIIVLNASLASQAVGPVMDGVEMSAAGRTFPELGKKLLAAKPLGLQKVSTADSVLGAYADTTTGLKVSYTSLIQSAFKPKYWNTTKTVKTGGKSYTMMQANFSLYWGLSIMLYEATLVADQTPMDQYLRHRTLTYQYPDTTGLQQLVNRLQADYTGLTVANVLNGLRLFENPPRPEGAGAGCTLCHIGPELTAASLGNQLVGVEPGDAALIAAGFDARMERMFLKLPSVPPGTTEVTLDPLVWSLTARPPLEPEPPYDVPVGVYDAGFYNIGARPEAENLGVGANDPWGKSLSIPRYMQETMANTASVMVPGAGLTCGTSLIRNSTGFPLLSGSLRNTERTFVDGSFKTPGLRNVELTGPYMHNGGKSTLMQVMELYDDGGDFNNPSKSPLIHPLGLTPTETRDLIAFLLSLTDERVRYQKAPFDHPQLFVPNGDGAPGVDNLVEIPAVGAAGAAAPKERFLNLNPFMP
jgi:cytochrome c peroxidase